MPLLRARELLDFIVKAFERAWDAMALADFDPEVGGKFMFARQAMVLLELASRVATEDEELHRAFSAEIERSQPLYFTPLPAGPSRWPKGFRLPYSRARDHSQRQLLPVLFDLVRNGQMHYGEQLSVPLKDGTIFGVALAESRQDGPSTSCGVNPAGRSITWLSTSAVAATSSCG